MEKILYHENFDDLKEIYTNEASGYTISRARRCKTDSVLIKIYTSKLSEKEKIEKAEKIMRLSRIENVMESTALSDIIVDSNGDFLGYSFGTKKTELLSRGKIINPLNKLSSKKNKLIMLKSLSETIKQLNKNGAYIFDFSDLESFATNGSRVPNMFPCNLDQIEIKGIDFKKSSDRMIGFEDPACADSYYFNILAFYLLSMHYFQGFEDTKMNLLYQRRDIDGTYYEPALPKELDSEKNRIILHKMLSKKGLYQGNRFEI